MKKSLLFTAHCAKIIKLSVRRYAAVAQLDRVTGYEPLFLFHITSISIIIVLSNHVNGIPKLFCSVCTKFLCCQLISKEQWQEMQYKQSMVDVATDA